MSKHNGNRETSRILPERLTAYALGQLEGHELAGAERLLAEPEQREARQVVAETRRLAETLSAAPAGDGVPDRSPQLRSAVLAQLEKQPDQQAVVLPRRSTWRNPIAWLTIGGAAAILVAALALPAVQARRNAARQTIARNELNQVGVAQENYHSTHRAAQQLASGRYELEGDLSELQEDRTKYQNYFVVPPVTNLAADPSSATARTFAAGTEDKPLQVEVNDFAEPAAVSTLPLAPTGTGGLQGQSAAEGARIANGGDAHGNRNLSTSPALHSGMSAAGSVAMGEHEAASVAVRSSRSEYIGELETTLQPGDGYSAYGREQYEQIIENGFLAPMQHPLSTFSIDVDTASYSNVRRFLTNGRLPPPAAVRVEELVNYFSYSYPQPKGREPFSVNMETAECPWRPGNLLLRVGLKGKEIHRTERPASNLVFLLDVSGSMADENKLPLLKTSLSLMVAELTENDRVSIVTYAGEAGLRLPPTSGDQKQRILAAIASLQSGGSTNGSAGIELAYEQAGQYFIKEGANRVILATDGDLNVGVTSDEALVGLIKNKAAAGTFLTVLGFGEGNLQDAKLEKLADNGNGMYAYIDSVREGRKVLVEQMSGSTIAIAKDVKIQIEFNPREIASYRLLGYENRMLAAKDFNDDKKDAGEIGAGHTVTALYELVPVGTKQADGNQQPVVEPLKYQSERISQIVVGDVPKAGSRELTEAASTGELLTLKLRYKAPDGVESRLVEFPLKERGGQFNAASKDLQFAAAVASFGMILRGSEHKGSGSLAAVGEIAGGALGDDASGYRAEFVDLVRRAQALGAK